MSEEWLETPAAGSSYLYVSLVRALVAIHTFHLRLVLFPEVNSEQGFAAHGVIDTGVVGREVHPADDEQPVHLQITAHTAVSISRQPSQGASTPIPAPIPKSQLQYQFKAIA